MGGSMRHLFTFLKLSLVFIVVSASITAGDWLPIFAMLCCWLCYKSVFEKMSLSHDDDEEIDISWDDSYNR